MRNIICNITLILSIILLYGCNDIQRDNTGESLSYITIKYHSNGGYGVMPEQTTTFTPVILNQNVFKKDGSVFVGWALSKSGPKEYLDGERIDIFPDNLVNGVLDLYAVWEIESNTYKVKYDSGGGTGDMSPSYVKMGEELRLPLNKFKKEGYCFEAWKDHIANKHYRDGDTIVVENHITLEAQWRKSNVEPVKVTLSFDSNGGSGIMDNILIEAGKDSRLPASKYTKEGYYFAGWSKIQNSSNIDYENEALINIDENTILYAVWNLKNSSDYITIIFHPNGGSGEPYTMEYNKNSMPIVLPENRFIHNDHSMKFIGWALNSYDTTPQYRDMESISSHTDLSLYAIWTNEKVYQLKFDADGGIGKPMPVLYAREGDIVTLPDPEKYVSRENHEARGYSDAPNSYSKYGIGSSFTMKSHDLILYVAWREVDLTLGGACEECKGNTYFFKGVNLPKYPSSEWNEIIKDESYYIGWDKKYGVYNVQQGDLNLCWAATASNVLHWWLDQNKDYINRYGKFNGPSEYKHNGNSIHSAIFADYAKHWKNSGQTATIGFAWYLSGLSNDSAMVAPNTGGYLKDVFKNKSMYEAYVFGGNRRNMTETAAKAIKEDGIMSYAYGNHAMTVWGVSFDEEGYVNGLYTTNSNNANAVYYRRIHYNSARKAYVKTLVGKDFYIDSVEGYSLGRKYWDEYFNYNQ